MGWWTAIEPGWWWWWSGIPFQNAVCWSLTNFFRFQICLKPEIVGSDSWWHPTTSFLVIFGRAKASYILFPATCNDIIAMEFIGFCQMVSVCCQRRHGGWPVGAGWNRTNWTNVRGLSIYRHGIFVWAPPWRPRQGPCPFRHWVCWICPSQRGTWKVCEILAGGREGLCSICLRQARNSWIAGPTRSLETLHQLGDHFQLGIQRWDYLI